MRDIARLCVILYLSQTLALPAQAAVDSGAYKQNHPVALVCKRHIAIYSGVSEAGTGQSYTQTGSDVLAPAGDITIAAKKVDILEARETSNNQTETKFKQSGLTLAVTSPVISAIQTAQQMSQAASNTRMCYVYSSTDECRLSGDDFAGRYTRFGSIAATCPGPLGVVANDWCQSAGLASLNPRGSLPRFPASWHTSPCVWLPLPLLRWPLGWPWAPFAQQL